MDQVVGGTSKEVSWQPQPPDMLPLRGSTHCGEGQCGVSITQVSLFNSLTTPTIRDFDSSECAIEAEPREYLVIDNSTRSSHVKTVIRRNTIEMLLLGNFVTSTGVEQSVF